MIIGFTGTRLGMNETQKKHVTNTLIELKPSEVHHVMCKGADIDFHNLVRKFLPDCKIHGHPGYSAKNKSNETVHVEVDVLHKKDIYFSRNRTIVNVSNLLIGTPYTEKHTSGGTWYTIDYADRKGSSLIIINR
jgi:hypothetical protein